jgi:hypothetical protein
MAYQRNDNDITVGSLLERDRSKTIYKVTKLWDEFRLTIVPLSLNGPGPEVYAELYQSDVACTDNSWFTHIEEV